MPPGELPEKTSVKLYGFLLKCNCSRALGVGQKCAAVDDPAPEVSESEENPQ